jgi:hypothetical protein
MKIRSQGAGQAEAVGRVESASADAKVRGQQLLKLASEHPLVPTTLLGVPKASVDALAGGLLEGALRALENRSGASRSNVGSNPGSDGRAPS